MGKLVSTIMLVAFVLISALANFGDSHAAARDMVKSSVENVVP